jgi:hypothetical protein
MCHSRGQQNGSILFLFFLSFSLLPFSSSFLFFPRPVLLSFCDGLAQRGYYRYFYVYFRVLYIFYLLFVIIIPHFTQFWRQVRGGASSMRRMYELAVSFEEERFQRELQLPRFQQTQTTQSQQLPSKKSVFFGHEIRGERERYSTITPIDVESCAGSDGATFNIST